MKIEHGIAPEYSDPIYSMELWWKDPESGKYVPVDTDVTKEASIAKDWLHTDLPNMEADEKDSVYEKRIVLGADTIAYRRFRICVIAQTIETYYNL